MSNKKIEDIESFLLHSEYFKRYIFPDWLRRNPTEGKFLIRKIREDEESEKEVQYHIERVKKG
jgi:hypothetical protein